MSIDREKVVSALENEKCVWKSVTYIAELTGLSEATVEAILSAPATRGFS
jgi:hypothetical protein